MNDDNVTTTINTNENDIQKSSSSNTIDIDIIRNSIDTMHIDDDDETTSTTFIDDDDDYRRVNDVDEEAKQRIKRDRMQTLSSSDTIESKKGRHLGVCLAEFTAEERLEGKNAYECEHCCSPRNKKVCNVCVFLKSFFLDS